MSKVYNSSVDFRVLSDEIKFVFYVSGRIKNKTFKKRKGFVLTYNTNAPVEVFVKIENNTKRVFLKFNQKYLKLDTYVDAIGMNKSDIILEVFIGTNGKHSFESVKGREYGAFLSHPNYYSPNEVGALSLPAGSNNNVNHPIKMILPSISKINLKGLSFDMDILSQYCGQYTTSLSLNCEYNDDVIIEGFTPSILVPKQVTLERKKVELQTVYLTLDNSSMGSGEVLYDYKKQLTKQNINPDALELTSSQVYAIENEFKVNANLTDFNLGYTNKIEIPYNVSREVKLGMVTESPNIVINGKEVSIIDWASEIRDNQIFSSVNRCLSLRFTTLAQQIAFGEKLKSQQIGSKEKYMVVDIQGRTTEVNRVYTDISQWIKRSTLNQFNDVRFTYDNQNLISEILICPRKKTYIGSTKSGRQNGLYTEGNELLLDGGNYIGYYHVGENSVPYSGRDPKGSVYEEGETSQVKKLEYLFNETPIQKNSNTDFCFTTHGRYGNIYSAYTTAITNTHDITISGASISASTVVPISDFNLNNPIPLINDYTKSYRPYAFYNVYNDGLIINEADSTDYMTYSAQSSGLYRFMYKGHLNATYKDTKWCEYLSQVYASAMTGNYPSTDYEIKRLINTSLINAGIGETNTALMDTNFKYYPGERGTNTDGIKGFSFVVSFVLTTSAGTESTLSEYKVLRTSDDGVANNYLKLQVTDIDKTSSGFTVCNFTGTSASTIFEYSNDISVDTGFINLGKGDKVQLKYSCVAETTSKLGTGGTSTLIVNLGHKLNDFGKKVEAPFFRAIKSASSVSKKQLFFDPTKKSEGFDIVVGDNTRTVNLDGSLFITDNGCNTISVPKVSTITFNDLTFVDSSGTNNVLTWDKTTKRPSNKWQTLIENNTIKDYTLKNGTINYMTKMLKDGIFKMCLPQYNQDYGATCLYKFPQQRHSYVVVNKFKDLYGKQIIHYIVITPKCGLFKPCTKEKPLTSYDILHKTTPDKWKIVNEDKKITIDGKVITIVNPKPGVEPPTVNCQYYCKCGQRVANKLGIDPIFGISEIMADNKSTDCFDCITRANEHCQKMSPSCKPVVINHCAEDGNLIDEVIKPGVTPIKPKGVKPKVTNEEDGGTNPGPSKPQTDCEYGECRYTCTEDMGCIEDPRGSFSSRDECVKKCVQKSRKSTKGFACVRQNTFSDFDTRGKTGEASTRVSSACIESPQGVFSSIEDCNKVCIERQCGCRCQPGGCKPDEPTGCGEWNNWCGSGSGSGNGEGEGRMRYECFEGLCFEDLKGQYSSIEKCKEGCKEIKDESDEDIRDDSIDEVITKEEKEKIRIDKLDNPLTPDAIKESLKTIDSKDVSEYAAFGICPDTFYFCKSINECLPNDIICPNQ